MKTTQILEIRESLIRLGDRDLPFAYEIAKNLKLCTAVATEVQELQKDIYNKLVDKDEEGKPLQYQDEKQGTITKITDPSKIEQYNTELNKLFNEDREVAFVKIPRAEIKASVPANWLVPLIGTVITE
jgi:hypothetical protein